MEGRSISLRNLNMDELTGVVNLYPWFGAARKELCSRMVKMGGSEWGKAQYADAALYVPSREIISDIFRSAHKEDYSDKDVETLLKAYVEPEKPKEEKESKPREYRRTVRVVGGDFFSQDDYDSVKRSDDNVFSKVKLSSSGPEKGSSWLDKDLGFCTETLAQIYAEQGYFAEAKKIYSRLILRYPEKSAYFASLIENLRQEN